MLDGVFDVQSESEQLRKRNRNDRGQLELKYKREEGCG